jgi:hypothetical protein
VSSAATFNESLSRLAQYRPFSDEGRDLKAAIEGLVVVSAVLAQGGFANLGACQDGVKTLWGVELEMDEIRTAVDDLEAADRCTRSRGGFTLTSEERDAQEAIAREMAAVEEKALDEWKGVVLGLEPAVTNEDFAALCSDLRVWLGRVVARHGVESALILYPENPRAQKLFSELEELGLSFLPARDGMAGQLRDRAFQLFVRQPTEAQRLFLANLLNTSFHHTVLTLDPAAARLIQERVMGHRVYLDTNFLYAVLGLSKATTVLAANRLLDLTRNLGYELAVTPWTIRELRTSLEGARNRIAKRPLPRRELADLLVKAAGDTGSFVSAFWVAYRDRGTQPKDFFEYFSHIETLLESHEIHVVKEGCTSVDNDRTAIGEQLVLLDRFLGWRDREERVKEHDVKHRLLIERLRGEGHIRFSNARYWFLTEDSKLPRYGAATLDGEFVDMPFCVSGSAWAQVVRAFTARTEDYDQTIVDLLATPYVRYRGAMNPRVVEDVVGRVDQFEGADIRLASEVLADTALVREIAEASDGDERNARIENAFVTKSQELLDRLEQLAEREAESRRAAEEAHRAAEAERGRTSKLERRLAAEREAAEERDLASRSYLEEQERVREREQRETAQRLRNEQTEKSALERQLADQRDELHNLKQVLQWLAAGALTLLGAAVACAPVTRHVNGVVEDSIAVVSGLLLLCAAVLVALGRIVGGRIITSLLLIVGLAGTVVTVVDVLTRPKR